MAFNICLVDCYVCERSPLTLYLTKNPSVAQESPFQPSWSMVSWTFGIRVMSQISGKHTWLMSGCLLLAVCGSKKLRIPFKPLGELTSFSTSGVFCFQSCHYDPNHTFSQSSGIPDILYCVHRDAYGAAAGLFLGTVWIGQQRLEWWNSLDAVH